MKSISLKIDDHIFTETEGILSELDKPRNRYINEAIEYYNSLQRRKIIAHKLRQESSLVAKNSMQVLSEFEALEDENQPI